MSINAVQPSVKKAQTCIPKPEINRASDVNSYFEPERNKISDAPEPAHSDFGSERFQKECSSVDNSTITLCSAPVFSLNDLEFTPENLGRAAKGSVFSNHTQAMNDMATAMFAYGSDESATGLDILDDNTGLLTASYDELQTLATIAELNGEESPAVIRGKDNNSYLYDADGDGEYEHSFNFDENSELHLQIYGYEQDIDGDGGTYSAGEDVTVRYWYDDDIDIIDGAEGDYGHLEESASPENGVIITKTDQNYTSSDNYTVDWDMYGDFESVKKSDE